MVAPDAVPGFHDVRMRGFQDRTDVESVLAILRDRVQPLAPETVGLRDAHGLVLATDVISDVAVPPFDRAAMDGYAVRGTETFGSSSYNPLAFQVVGVALPGKPFLGVVAKGSAVRIMTGAPLPAGADAVAPAEYAEEDPIGEVRVKEAIPPGRHVGVRGEDIAPGAVVLRKGRVLRPQDIGILAAIGLSAVTVVRKPRVAVVITGDELLPCGSKPEVNRIIDSNSVMLEALVHRDGGVATTRPILPDRHDAVRTAIMSAAADVILIAGGSSVGQEDHAPRVLAEIGELRVHGVALRPASPTGFGFVGKQVVFLLPGNPVSCLCAYDLFAGLAVRRLGGREMAMPYRTASLPLARKISSANGRVDYVRVLVCNGLVEPLAISGASILSSTTRADGFVLVPRDSEGHAPGEFVSVHYYDP